MPIMYFYVNGCIWVHLLLTTYLMSCASPILQRKVHVIATLLTLLQLSTALDHRLRHSYTPPLVVSLLVGTFPRSPLER